MTPCIEWTRARNRDGYGCRNVDGRVLRVHRLAWEEANGPIPDGMNVLHRCDNRSCYNVEHLFLGTQADNVQDMKTKGRAVPPPHHFGGDHPTAKLSDAEVVAMRQQYQQGGISQRKLAARFGVTQSCVHLIVSGKQRVNSLDATVVE